MNVMIKWSLFCSFKIKPELHYDVLITSQSPYLFCIYQVIIINLKLTNFNKFNLIYNGHKPPAQLEMAADLPFDYMLCRICLRK